MEMEESLRSKSLYKLLLIMLKYMPMLITLFYVANTAISTIKQPIKVAFFYLKCSSRLKFYIYI